MPITGIRQLPNVTPTHVSYLQNNFGMETNCNGSVYWAIPAIVYIGGSACKVILGNGLYGRDKGGVIFFAKA